MATLYDKLLAHSNNKKDRKIFGLVLQGGGMRAVYSAGAIVPLIKYGFVDTFEHVLGASAGAINGAYFLGADEQTMDSYTQDLTNTDFINLLRKDKKVDIDYLVDLVLKNKRPINIDNLRKSHSKLHVVLTDAKTGSKVVVSDHNKFADIYEEFRATSALPILYDKPVLIDKKWYIDGGVSDLLPIDVAIKLGCTDIVVVMTHQVSSYKFNQHHKRLVKRLMKHLAKNQSELIRDKLPTNEKLLEMNLRRLRHPLKKVRFYVLEPSQEEYLISLSTIDKSKVGVLGKMGVKDMDKFLNKELPF